MRTPLISSALLALILALAACTNPPQSSLPGGDTTITTPPPAPPSPPEPPPPPPPPDDPPITPPAPPPPPEAQSCLSDPTDPCDAKFVSESNPDLDAQAQFDAPENTARAQPLAVNTWYEGAYTSLLGGGSNYPATREIGDVALGQIALDNQLNLIAGGNIAPRYGPDKGQGFVLKDLNDTVLWKRKFGATAQTTYVNAVATDSARNVYAAGWTTGDLDGITNGGDRDAFVIKFNPQGNRLWTRLIGTTGHEGATGLVVDSQDHVYVTGYTNAALSGLKIAGQFDQFLIRFTPKGKHQWTTLLGSSGNETAGRIALGDGKVYIVGSTTGSLKNQPNTGADDVFAAQFTLLGKLKWTRTLGSGKNEYASGVTANSSGVWVVGRTYSQQLFGETSYLVKWPCPMNSYHTFSDAFITKLDPSGVSLWGHLIPNASDETGNPPAQYVRQLHCRADATDVSLDAQGRAVVLARLEYGAVPAPEFDWQYRALAFNASGQRVAQRDMFGSGQYDASLESSSLVITDQFVLVGVSRGDVNAATDHFDLTVKAVP